MFTQNTTSKDQKLYLCMCVKQRLPGYTQTRVHHQNTGQPCGYSQHHIHSPPDARR